MMVQLLVICTPNLGALQTDGQTDDMMMPIADHAEYPYDRLKTHVTENQLC